MEKRFAFLLFICLSKVAASCSDKKDIMYFVQGRTEVVSGNIRLIGAASSITFDFTGTNCLLKLQSVDTDPHHNYVSLELDGKYIGRLRVEAGEMREYPVAVKGKGHHRLVVCKATEAANGYVDFLGTTAKVQPYGDFKKRKKIEFVGDSITSGMGNDFAQVPCGTGEWYDQHNAYWSYAAITARTLDVEFLLSSVSGIGMYRNWNDDHEKEANMPEVYGRLHLKLESDTPFDATFQPDIVTICLGTNDLSLGDGTKPRAAFDEKKYTENYIAFVQMIYGRYPNTEIVLLTSPMVNGARHQVLLKCLRTVVSAFASDKAHKPLSIFEFKPMAPNGCGYHPSIDDDKKMASGLVPFLKKRLDEK